MQEQRKSEEGANVVITMQQACNAQRIQLAIRTECYSSNYKCESCLAIQKQGLSNTSGDAEQKLNLHWMFDKTHNRAQTGLLMEGFKGYLFPNRHMGLFRVEKTWIM